MVDAGQKTPTPMSVFNDRKCQISVIAHSLGAAERGVGARLVSFPSALVAVTGRGSGAPRTVRWCRSSAIYDWRAAIVVAVGTTHAPLPMRWPRRRTVGRCRAS